MRSHCFLWGLLCLVSTFSFGQEICNNGRDDDRDGMADLNDPECQCRYTLPKNLLLNGSFEDGSHCPTYVYNNDYNIIRHWRYGTFTNREEAQYYHSLQCPLDSYFVMKYIPPPLPLPSGNALVSIRQGLYRRPGYTEKDVAKTYISQCLQSPLTTGEEYIFSFSAGRFRSNDDSAFKYRNEPFTVAIFGHADCNAVPFGSRSVNSNGCPENFPGWKLLGQRTLKSDGRWVQHRINFTAPPGINVLAIGPDCSTLKPDTELVDSTTFADFYVYYLDDVNLLPAKELPLPVVQTVSGDRCAGDRMLTAPTLPGAVYQWYKDSLAIASANEMTYHVPAFGDGFYNVRVSTTDTCFITEAFYIGNSPLSQLRLPTDTILCKGETVLLAPPVDAITYTFNGTASNTVAVSQQGVYTLTATDANGCTRSFTVNVQEQECNASVLMPDAFTPNGDGINDVFRIPPNSPIHLEEFAVFNRWGQKVFSTRNKSIGWTGQESNKKPPPGTYVYLITGFRSNKRFTAKGTVSLIR